MAPSKARTEGSDVTVQSDNSMPDANDDEASHQGDQGPKVIY